MAPTESQKAKARRYYLKNRERSLAYQKARREGFGPEEREAYLRHLRQYHKQRRIRISSDEKAWAREKVAALRRRAAEKGLDFDLTEADIRIPKTCPILGIPVSIERGTPKGNYASIDRVDNQRGYTRDNIAVISFKANGLKRDITPDQARALVTYLELHNLTA